MKNNAMWFNAGRYFSIRLFRSVGFIHPLSFKWPAAPFPRGAGSVGPVSPFRYRKIMGPLAEVDVHPGLKNEGVGSGNELDITG